MSPELVQAFMGVSGLCVMQKLAAVKMAIRVEADTQKSVAIDAGIDEAQFARKLLDKEALTFRDFDKLPLEVQRTALLEMLAQAGLPQRVHRWLSIAQAVEPRRKQSA